MLLSGTLSTFQGWKYDSVSVYLRVFKLFYEKNFPFCITYIFSSCNQNNQIDVEVTDNVMVSEPLVNRGLGQVLEDGVLRAVMVYSGTSYFLYRGLTMGYEYDLLQRLAEHLNVELEIVLTGVLTT